MRTLLVSLLAVAGCADLPPDGALECNPNPAHACPDGYQCIADRCYRDGHGPDLAASVGDDMASFDLGDDDGGSRDGGGMSMPDLAPALCGVTGAACCAAPFAPCTNAGTICSTDNVCVANDVWIVGTVLGSGLTPSVGLWHYSNGVYTAYTPSAPLGVSDSHGSAIWGYAPGNFLAASDQGEVYEDEGGTWKVCVSPDSCYASTTTSTDFSAIFGVSASDYWLGATNNSALFHRESSAWVLRTNGLPSSFDVQRITGSASDDIWFTGFAGTGHWNGSAWTFDNSVTGRSIWSNARNDVWAVGDNFIKHYNGTAWTAYGIDGGTIPGSVWMVGGSSSTDVWASYTVTGSTYSLAHFDGSAWTSKPVPTGSTDLPSGIWMASKTQGWIATSFGLWELKSGVWTVITLPTPTGFINNVVGGVWGSANAGH